MAKKTKASKATSIKVQVEGLRGALTGIRLGAEKVELYAKDGIVTVRGIAEDWNVRVHLKAEVVGPPRMAVVDCRELLQFTSRARGVATLTLAESVWTASTDKLSEKGKLGHVGATGFEVKVAKDGTVKTQVRAAHNALALATQAVGKDPTRPELSGVYLSGDSAVGCDGHRLHHAKLDTPMAGILPETAVDSVLRVLTELGVDDHAALTIGMGTKPQPGVRFMAISEAGLVEADVRCMKGQYPDYRTVLSNAKPSHWVSFSREAMLRAVQSVPSTMVARLKFKLPTFITVEACEWDPRKPKIAPKVKAAVDVPCTPSGTMPSGTWAWAFDRKYLVSPLVWQEDVDRMLMGFGAGKGGAPAHDEAALMVADGEPGAALVMPKKCGEAFKPSKASKPKADPKLTAQLKASVKQAKAKKAA